jgi:hypothetical protein
MVLVLVALAGCASTHGGSFVADGKCFSTALPSANAPIERSWVHSIDPQVALTAYQLYCMKDTPLGL